VLYQSLLLLSLIGDVNLLDEFNPLVSVESTKPIVNHSPLEYAPDELVAFKTGVTQKQTTRVGLQVRFTNAVDGT
jgi:hypothetical protein